MSSTSTRGKWVSPSAPPEEDARAWQKGKPTEPTITGWYQAPRLRASSNEMLPVEAAPLLAAKAHTNVVSITNCAHHAPTQTVFTKMTERTSVSVDCLAIRPKHPPPPGSMQGIPEFRLQSGKVERRSGRPRRLRQYMRWRSDCGPSALFSTHDTHADLMTQVLEPMKREMRNNCATRRATRNICVCAASGEVFSLRPVAGTTFANVCRRNLRRKTTNAQDSCKRGNGSNRLYLLHLPPLMILPFFLLSFLPLLRFFQLLRIPSCR